MNEQTIDSVAKQAAALSRRASLLAVGGAVLATVHRRPESAVAKGGKKARKQKQKKSCQEARQEACRICQSDAQVTCDARVRQEVERCQSDAQTACQGQIRQAVEDEIRVTRETQLRACQDEVQIRCASEADPDECVLRAGICCDYFVRGEDNAAVECLLVALIKV